MHHCCFRQGLRVFFEPEPSPSRGIATPPIPIPLPCRLTNAGSSGHGPRERHCTPGQSDSKGFTPIIQLAITIGLGMVVQHTVQSLLGVPAFGAEHRARRRVQSRRHLGSAPALISLEQDARPIDDPSGALAATDQPLQLLPIFHRQPYRILLRCHGCRTSRTPACQTAYNQSPIRASSAFSGLSQYQSITLRPLC